MKSKEAVARRQLAGRITVWDVDEKTGLRLPLPRFSQPNQIQASWGHIAARQIGFKRPVGALDYSLSAMYFEFENVADPDDVITPPDYGEDEGIEYYDDLVGSATKDFLRIPLTTEPTLGIESDFDIFTAGLSGNKLTFHAQTAGLVGVNGKEFSSDANSKIYGVALVAAPVLNDRTKDEIFARTYFQTDEQVVKALSHQASIDWDVVFGV